MNTEVLQASPRIALIRRLSRFMLWIGVGWGLLMLGFGFLASFGMGAHETPRSLAGFALVFIVPIVGSLAAWRWMRIAGIALLLSVPLALFCIAENWSDVVQVMSRVYLWPHLLFGLLFFVLGQKPEFLRRLSPNQK